MVVIAMTYKLEENIIHMETGVSTVSHSGTNINLTTRTT